MARETKLKIMDTDMGVVCDVKMMNLSGRKPRSVGGVPIEVKSDGSPKMKYKDSQGNELFFTNTHEGVPVMTSGRAYADVNGVIQDPIPYLQLEDGTEVVAEPRPKSEVFEVTWLPKGTEDNYLIEKVYQLKPSKGDSKKDIIRKQNINANTASMKKLYDHMIDNKVVGKAVCNVSSTGKLDYVGFMRAIDLGSEWTIEIVIAKQEKLYAWQESKDFQAQQTTAIPNNGATVDAL